MWTIKASDSPGLDCEKKVGKLKILKVENKFRSGVEFVQNDDYRQ